MIKLSEYARLLCEKMTTSDAVSIFAKHGVPNALNLDKEALQKAWRELNKKFHTDVSDTAKETIQNINAAYDILKTSSTSSADDFIKRYQANAYKNQGQEPEPWQTDTRAARYPDPQKGNVNYYKKLAWIISGKPASTDDNKYTFWNWDGYYLRGVFTVYTTPAHWFEVSKLMTDWDGIHHRSKAVLVTYNKAPKMAFIVNKEGQRVDPPTQIPHESNNSNPENDWGFTDRMRKMV